MLSQLPHRLQSASRSRALDTDSPYLLVQLAPVSSASSDGLYHPFSMTASGDPLVEQKAAKPRAVSAISPSTAVSVVKHATYVSKLTSIGALPPRAILPVQRLCWSLAASSTSVESLLKRRVCPAAGPWVCAKAYFCPPKRSPKRAWRCGGRRERERRSQHGDPASRKGQVTASHRAVLVHEGLDVELELLHVQDAVLLPRDMEVAEVLGDAELRVGHFGVSVDGCCGAVDLSGMSMWGRERKGTGLDC